MVINEGELEKHEYERRFHGGKERGGACIGGIDIL